MTKVFDLDEYLVDKGITIKLKGKEFTVTDIPYGIAEKLKETSEEGQKAAVKEIVGCTDDDLKGYGIAAISAIIRNITENLFQEPSQKTPSQE